MVFVYNDLNFYLGLHAFCGKKFHYYFLEGGSASNEFSLVLLWKCIYFISFWNTLFLDKAILLDSFIYYLLIYLLTYLFIGGRIDYFTHCLLNSIVPDERSAINLIREVPIGSDKWFYLAIFKIASWFLLIIIFYYSISGCATLCMYYTWSSLNF